MSSSTIKSGSAASQHEVDEAKLRLNQVLPHIRTAAIMAHAAAIDGELKLAIISRRPDGTGSVGASFELKAFLDDIGLVIGEKEYLAAEEQDGCARCGEQPEDCDCTGGWQDPSSAEHNETHL